MGMASIWHKTMVYFGMADDEEDYEEQTLAQQESREQPAADRAAVRKVERAGSEKSSRSRRRGSEFDDIFGEEDNFRTQRTSVVRPLPTPNERPNVRVHLVEPKNFNDAQLIADKFKSDVPVILNLQRSDTELSKRLIDFSSGLTYALEGGIERVADKVFLLTPQNVEVSAEEKQRLLEKGFFNQF